MDGLLLIHGLRCLVDSLLLIRWLGSLIDGLLLIHGLGSLLDRWCRLRSGFEEIWDAREIEKTLGLGHWLAGTELFFKS